MLLDTRQNVSEASVTHAPLFPDPSERNASLPQLNGRPLASFRERFDSLWHACGTLRLMRKSTALYSGAKQKVLVLTPYINAGIE
jgi:hypothetical protein